MGRHAPRIGLEVAMVGLVLASLAGTAWLLSRVHRREVAPRLVVVAVAPTAPPPEEPEPPEPPAPAEPEPIDATPEFVSRIEAEIAAHVARGEAAERKATEIEAEIATARAQAGEWRRRIAVLREQGAERAAELTRAEWERDSLARRRDALIQDRDALREQVERERLRAKDGVAVLPYKGPNGTWRRPIAIECRGGTATLQPGGPSLTLSDMAGFASPRSNPLVLEVAKAMVRARSVPTPDGAASVPYLVFVVRPDGVRPFYAARMVLEPLGITYGYELADADWDIEFPDLNDPAEWSESGASRRKPHMAAAADQRRAGRDRRARAGRLRARGRTRRASWVGRLRARGRTRRASWVGRRESRKRRCRDDR